MIVKRRQFRHTNKIFTPSFSIIFASFMVLLLFVGYLRFGEEAKNSFSGINLPFLSLSVPKFNFSLPSINVSLPDLSSLKSKTGGNISNVTQETEPKTKTSLALENPPTNVPEYQKLKEDKSFDVTIDSQDIMDGNLVATFHHNSNQVQPIRVEGDIKYDLSASESSANQSVKLTIYNWSNQYFRVVVGSTSEVLAFGKPKKKTIDTSLKDHSGKDIDAGIEIIDKELHTVVYNNTGNKHNAQINEGKYDIRVTPHGNRVSAIYFEDAQIFSNLSKLVNLDEPEDKQGSLELYVVDPSGLNFTRAKVTVGNTIGDGLSKCKDWNFTTRTCDGNWQFIKQITPGQSYEFYITPGDPALSTSAGFFSEQFEVGNYQATNGWTNTTTATRRWKSTTTTPLAGTRSADATADEISNATVYLNLSTAGWNNITIAWKWSVAAGTLTTINASYWNGASWVQMKTLAAGLSEQNFKFNKTATTVQNTTSPKFRIKFLCHVTTIAGSGRTCQVDDVNVTGLIAVLPIVSASTNRTTSTTAVINWTTNRPSNTTVKYGTTASLGTTRRINNAVTAHNVTLTGLIAGTKYFYNISSDYFGNTQLNGSFKLLTASTIPAISALNKSAIRQSSAVINWTTDQNSNATINYGKTNALGTKITRTNTNRLTLHNFSLTGLRAGQSYSFNATSCTSAGCKFNNTPSFTFTTKSNVTISAKNHSGITKTTAVINWTTNVAANTSVNYGTGVSLGTKRSIQNSVTSHNVTLTGLSASTLYRYNISSCLFDSCKVNGTFNFTTHANNPPVIVSIADTPDPILKNKFITITANVTAGDSAISKVWVQINKTNSTMLRQNLTNGRRDVLFIDTAEGYNLPTDPLANGWDGDPTYSAGTGGWRPQTTATNCFGGAGSCLDGVGAGAGTALEHVNITQTTNIPTTGYNNISVDAYSTCTGTPTAAYMILLAYDGSSWANVYNSSRDQGCGASPAYHRVNLTSAYNNLATFKIDYLCISPTASAACQIDNINVSGLFVTGHTGYYQKSYNVTTLSGLKNYTVYANDTGNVAATSKLANFTVVSSLTISHVMSSGIKGTQAVINWTTNVVTNTSVHYGKVKSLGTASQTFDSVMAHSRTLASLTNNTLYFFNVSSCSGGTCKINGTFNFTTTSTTLGTNTSTTRVKSCLAMQNSVTTNNYILNCDGTYPASCGTAPSHDLLSCNDGNSEGQTYGTSQFAGLKINISSNVTVNDCVSVNQVLLCKEEWLSANTVENCFTKVDKGSGTSFTTVTTDCPGLTANPGVTCYDVTSLESWTCNDFFSASPTGARAETQVTRTASGQPATLNTDALYFNVSYSPAIAISNVNKSGLTATTAVINWTTNVASNTTVKYGTAKSLGTNRRINNAVTAHNVTLTSLSASTRYFFNVSSCASSTNCQDSGPFNFTTHSNADTTRPLVFDKYPRNATVYNVTNKITIAVNVTDNIAVSIVKANITRPGGNITRIRLLLSTANRYNRTFTIPNVTGRYNITFDANDTSNNHNASVKTTFRANDIIVPTILKFNATPNPALPTQIVNFTANVTDNIGVSRVKVTFRGANLSMKRIGSTLTYFNDTVSLSGIYAGTYKFTIYANDTSNNAASASSNLVISALTSIRVFNTPINFTSGFAGNVLNATLLHGFPLQVKNTGNVNISLNISGTNLTGRTNSQKIKSTRVEWDNNSLFSVIRKLNYSHIQVISSLNINKNSSFFFRLRAPTGIKSQNFSGNVTFTAKS